MADEKTTPTPKVAKTDTMHSTPDAPDRSKMSDSQLEKERRNEVTGPSTPGTEGEKYTIKSKDNHAGTLVVDLPSAEEVASGKRDELAQGDKLALQPGERREQGKVRKAKPTSNGSRSKSSGTKQTDTATGKTSVARPETQPDPGK